MKEIKKDDPISKEIPLEKPLKTSSRLGREAKIGVTVILTLMIVFGVVVVRRISGSKHADQAMIPPPAQEEDGLSRDKEKGSERPFGEGRPNPPPKDGKKFFPGAGQANVVQPESSKLGLGGDPSKHRPDKGGKFDRPEESAPPKNPPLFPDTPKPDPALADNLQPKPHHIPKEDPLGAPKIDSLGSHEHHQREHEPKPNDDGLAMIPPAPNGATPPPDGGFPPPNPRREPQLPRHDEFGVEHREANESQTNIGVVSDPPPAPQMQPRYGNSLDISSQSPPNSNRAPEKRWENMQPPERPLPSEMARREPPRKPSTMDEDRGFERSNKGPYHHEPMGPPREDGKYEIQPNDSYWTISKKVYRTDGYFKALAEYNRSKGVDGDHLKPGELIETPSIAQLEQKYPELCPKATHRETPQGKYQSVGMTQPTHGSHTYTVVEGDTLFNIARYELGKASRWAEIYDINREVLGKDFNYLVPGTQLRLPQDSKSEKSDMQARQAGNAWK